MWLCSVEDAEEGLCQSEHHYPKLGSCPKSLLAQPGPPSQLPRRPRSPFGSFPSEARPPPWRPTAMPPRRTARPWRPFVPSLPLGPTHGRGEAQLARHHGGGCWWTRAASYVRSAGLSSRAAPAGPSRKPGAEAERGRTGGCRAEGRGEPAECGGARAGGGGRAEAAGRGGERRSSCLGARGVSPPGNPVRGAGLGGLRLWEGRTRGAPAPCRPEELGAGGRERLAARYGAVRSGAAARRKGSLGERRRSRGRAPGHNRECEGGTAWRRSRPATGGALPGGGTRGAGAARCLAAASRSREGRLP